MSDPASSELRSALDDATRQVALYEQRVAALEAEVARTAAWRKSSLSAVVAVAVLAILMLGVVAFNAVDDSTAEDGAGQFSGSEARTPSTTSALVAPVIEEHFDTVAECDPGGPMSAMIACPLEEVLVVDDEIDSVAAEIFDAFRSDEARTQFVVGEEVWLIYRLEHCRSRGDEFEGGSLARLVAAECLVRESVRHLDELEQFLADLAPE